MVREGRVYIARTRFAAGTATTAIDCHNAATGRRIGGRTSARCRTAGKPSRAGASPADAGRAERGLLFALGRHRGPGCAERPAALGGALSQPRAVDGQRRTLTAGPGSLPGPCRSAVRGPRRPGSHPVPGRLQWPAAVGEQGHRGGSSAGRGPGALDLHHRLPAARHPGAGGGHRQRPAPVGPARRRQRAAHPGPRARGRRRGLLADRQRPAQSWACRTANRWTSIRRGCGTFRWATWPWATAAWWWPPPTNCMATSRPAVAWNKRGRNRPRSLPKGASATDWPWPSGTRDWASKP